MAKTVTVAFRKQTMLHQPEAHMEGNSFVTCIANILELPIEQCPRIEYLMECKLAPDLWWTATVSWLKYMGFRITYVDAINWKDKVSPGEIYIITGQSHRGPYSHSVLAQDGIVIFDPHPDDSGVIVNEKSYAFVIRPINQTS